MLDSSHAHDPKRQPESRPAEPVPALVSSLNSNSFSSSVSNPPIVKESLPSSHSVSSHSDCSSSKPISRPHVSTEITPTPKPNTTHITHTVYTQEEIERIVQEHKKASDFEKRVHASKLAKEFTRKQMLHGIQHKSTRIRYRTQTCRQIRTWCPRPQTQATQVQAKTNTTRKG
jgi:hypothetical protein